MSHIKLNMTNGISTEPLHVTY